jgi:hypothetical protein
MAEDVVIVGGARTPFCEWVGGKRGDGKTGGLLKSVSAQELGGIAIKGALEATGTDPGLCRSCRHGLRTSDMLSIDLRLTPCGLARRNPTRGTNAYPVPYLRFWCSIHRHRCSDDHAR